MASSTGHILIIDDVLAKLRLLRAMLAEHGFETRGVPNGTKALRAARDEASRELDGGEIRGYQHLIDSFAQVRM